MSKNEAYITYLPANARRFRGILNALKYNIVRDLRSSRSFILSVEGHAASGSFVDTAGTPASPLPNR